MPVAIGWHYGTTSHGGQVEGQQRNKRNKAETADLRDAHRLEVWRRMWRKSRRGLRPRVEDVDEWLETVRRCEATSGKCHSMGVTYYTSTRGQLSRREHSKGRRQKGGGGGRRERRVRGRGPEEGPFKPGAQRDQWVNGPLCHSDKKEARGSRTKGRKISPSDGPVWASVAIFASQNTISWTVGRASVMDLD
ncbi:unnamed protein product [Somion occarium]|uniref:Uncharacterized protein n=1 Tax=Somion occarium TaxID=3059160 RepID=A0ABP1D7V2_9APHY